MSNKSKIVIEKKFIELYYSFIIKSNRYKSFCFREPQGVFHQVWRHHRGHGHERSHYATIKVSTLYFILFY